LTRAREISDFAEANLKYTAGTRKGYQMGYWDAGEVRTERSVEFNIDHYKLNDLLARELTAQGDTQAAAVYATRAAYAAYFVQQMFDPVEGKFYTGTLPDSDTINTSSIPLDAQLWAALAMARSPDYQSWIDWRRPVAYCDAHLVATDGTFQGYTYSTRSTAGKVWFEGVGQGAAVRALFGEQAKQDEAVRMLELARLSHPNADGLGIVAASSDVLRDAELNNSYYARLGAAPTAFAYFAENDINPFDNVVGGANQWGLAGGGDWAASGNWSQGQVPDNNFAKARLWENLGASSTVDLGGAERRLKILSFRNAQASYTVGGSGGGTLVLVSGDAEPASIRAETGNAQDHAVASAVRFESDAIIAFGGAALTLSGRQDWNGKALAVQQGTVRYLAAQYAANTAGASLTIASGATVELGGTASATSDNNPATADTNIVNHSLSGGLKIVGGRQQVGSLTGAGRTAVATGAALEAQHVRQATLEIAAGATVTISPNAGPSNKAAGVSLLTETSTPNNALKIAAGGALDLNNNDLIVYYPAGGGAATLANLQQYVYDGFLNTAAAPQIQADAAMGSYQTYAVAFDNAALSTPWASWDGQTLSGSNQVIVKYTFRGDLDLNGLVDGNDFTVIQQNFGLTGLGVGRGWLKGDADLDGDVDGNDFTIIQQNFGAGSGGALTPPEGSAVPEPSMLALALSALGVAWFWRRKRR
jgi:hypothetical protein